MTVKVQEQIKRPLKEKKAEEDYDKYFPKSQRRKEF